MRSHFPGSDAEIVKKYAKEFGIISFAGQGIKELYSVQKTAEKDRELLAKIVRDLKRASSSLGGTGFHGRSALYQYANEIDNPENPVYASADIKGVPSVIAGKIDEIVDRFKDAATRIDPDTLSVSEILGGHKKPGRPIHIASQLVARGCRFVFERLGDVPATRRSDWRTGKSHGPLLDFVKEVLNALGIEANAEVAIRTNPRLDKIL